MKERNKNIIENNIKTDHQLDIAENADELGIPRGGIAQSDLDLLNQQITTGQKEYALLTLNKIINVHGREYISDIKVSINAETCVQFTATLLYSAVLYDNDLVVSRLLNCGVDIDEGTTCESDQSYDRRSPLMVACEENNVNVIRILLKNNPNLLLKDSEGFSVLMYIVSIEVLHLILSEAKKRNCIYQLISIKTNKGNDIYSYHCDTGRINILTELMKIENYQASINIRLFLSNARIAYWSKPNKSKEFNKVCLSLRNLNQYHEVKEFTKDSSNLCFSTAHHTLFGHIQFEDFSIRNRQKKIKMAIAKLYSLLASPKKCSKYLQFLNNEFARYFHEKHGKNFPSLDPHSYEFKIIDGTYYPIPKRNYVKIDKYHALQEYLVILFNKNNIAKRAYKWIGFIPNEIANEMVVNGDMLTEDRLGTGLLHGKLTHMIQRAILIYAIENEEIQLDDITINDIFHALVTMNKHNENSKLWVTVQDTRDLGIVTFTDPHRLGSVIMRNGDELGINALSDSLIDTFCNGLMHLLCAYKKHQSYSYLDLNTFVDYMNDMGSGTFFANFVTKNSIKTEICKGTINDEDETFSYEHACVPKSYSSNINFEPRRFHM